MKNIKIIIVSIFLGLTAMSCEDYLDVVPEDKILESQIFEDKIAIESVLNGVYINLTNSSLYGGELTMGAVDVLGQGYKVFDEDHVYYSVGSYDYQAQRNKDYFQGIWNAAYAQILNINKFIENTDQISEVMGEEKASILLGEAYALRAFIHFDMLRLYGPVYSVAPGAEAIPYITKASSETSPILNADQVLSFIEADMNTALGLLENDPVREYGPISESQEDESEYLPEGSELEPYTGGDFYRFRNFRMNYFATRAVQARVALYKGDKEQAISSAQEVIDFANGFFPWTTPSDVISSGQPDFLFSPEVLFGLYNESLYDAFDRYYNPISTELRLLIPFLSRLEQTYESNLNDYRFASSWLVPSNSDNLDKAFFKYTNTGNENSYRLQPLVRMSEMYLIASEASATDAMGLPYLNALRYNRGLVDLEVGVDLAGEIQKEYAKEFYGEGQLFFFYKRLNVGLIPNGSAEGEDIQMSELEYVVPLPDSELDYR